MTPQELETRFTYHAPSKEQIPLYEEIRYQVRKLAEFIVANTPESREQSLSLTALDEATFWANAAIARRSNGA